MKDLLTAQQLAERLNVTHWTIQNWRKTGRIPAVVLSPKVIRFDYEDVMQALRYGQHADKPSDIQKKGTS